MQLIHYSDRPVLAVHSIEQTTRIPSEYSKPHGFWVSDDDCADNWHAWCISEEFNLEGLSHVHDVTLTDQANILHLSTAPDLDAFADRFGVPIPRDAGVWAGCRYIDWVQVAAQHDGIIVTPYVWSRRLHDGYSWYYTWDCAGGCIWNAAAIARIVLRAVISIPCDTAGS